MWWRDLLVVLHSTIPGIPFFSFALTYAIETLRGPQKSALFTAAYNPCDEHDPNGCTSTILDQTVYSDDVSAIPYVEWLNSDKAQNLRKFDCVNVTAEAKNAKWRPEVAESIFMYH